MKVFDVYQQGYQHKNLIFWTAMLNSIADPISKDHRILDFGCGQGLFLRLLYDFFPYQQGVGIDLDLNSIEYACSQLNKQGNQYPIGYFVNNQFDFNAHQEYFDKIFCQEILWCNENIYEVAQILYSLLKKRWSMLYDSRLS